MTIFDLLADTPQTVRTICERRYPGQRPSAVAQHLYAELFRELSAGRCRIVTPAANPFDCEIAEIVGGPNNKD